MGFYAELETNCKVYYMCDDHGNKFTYRCPEDTAFRQDALICDHAHLVDCQGNKRSNYESVTNKELNDDKSFSRSFKIVKEPMGAGTNSNTTTSSTDSGFVLRASVFLRNRQGDVDKQIRTTSSRPFLDRGRITINRLLAPPFEDYPTRRVENLEVNESVRSTTKETPRPSVINQYDYSQYAETLKSIQLSGSSTTLKPLVPNQLEYDPYYPNTPTTTDAYYTPIHERDPKRFLEISTETPTATKFQFKIPDVLPDSNALEDLVDRRKYFFIPPKSIKRSTQWKF